MTYRWDWRWNLERLFPWLLPLLLLAWRRNRSLRASVAFVPGLASMFCADLITWPIGKVVAPEAQYVAAEMLIPFAAGLTAVWLASGESSVDPVRAASRSFLILVVAAILSAGAAVAYDLDPPGSPFIAYGVCCLLPLGIAASAAVRASKREQTTRRFTVVFLVTIALTVVAAAALCVVVATMETSDHSKLGTAFIACLAFGIPCCFSVATFVVFTCISTEYRERWRSDLESVTGALKADAGVSAKNLDV